MRFQPITTADHPMYPRAMELYHASFPIHEQREPVSQRQIMNHPEYQFNLICDGDLFVGLVLCWETAAFIYVEHFCILPELRNHKYGQRALTLLHQRGKPVILEIDPPVDAISLRRKAFYERLNYHANPYEHIHPPYHVGYDGHSLVVMSCPNALPDRLYHEFFQYLKTVVMSGSEP